VGVAILVIGKSGSGKSASLRNFNPADVAVINVLGKPMPFRGQLKQIITDDYGAVINALSKATRDAIVIDDAGYLITNQFMRGHSQTGAGNAVFQLYNQLAGNFWGLVSMIQVLPPEKRVYVMMHEDEHDSGTVKPKTIGKLLDEKVCVEGMFTICLRAIVQDGKHMFRTQTNGLDVAKSPIGMFAADEIDNDLAAVDAAIMDYYGIKRREEKAQ